MNSPKLTHKDALSYLHRHPLVLEALRLSDVIVRVIFECDLHIGVFLTEDNDCVVLFRRLSAM